MLLEIRDDQQQIVLPAAEGSSSLQGNASGVIEC